MTIKRSSDARSIVPGDIILHNCACVLRAIRSDEDYLYAEEVEYSESLQDYTAIGSAERFSLSDLIGDTVNE